MVEVEQSVFVVRPGAKRTSGLPSPWSALSLIADMPSFCGMSARGQLRTPDQSNSINSP